MLTNGRNNQNVVARDQLLGPAVTRTASPPHKLFHLVFESHDGRCMGQRGDIASILINVNRWSAPRRS